ncbi:Anaphase-promoting complex subunit 7 [Cucurbita argyrosperma subsp. argyrosperma]|nr:Anaphase-promoting complex subunit 7 [Cucurbita argyrosperma subsp. argyrosperma]
MEVPKDQISTLLDQGLYSSAQMLGCFLVSSPAANSESSPHLKSESLVLLGDALFREREYRRAIHTYKQALQYYKIIPKQNSTTTRSSLQSNRASSPNSFNVSAINENEVKFKIASCYCALSDNRAALVEMEGIPSKARNLQMILLMGKLYRYARHNRAAIAYYKECLRHCPYVFEAIIALAELGVAAKDIISLFPQNLQTSMLKIGFTRLQLEAAKLLLITSIQIAGCYAMLRPSVALLPMITKVVWSCFRTCCNVFPIIFTCYLKLQRRVEAVIGKNDEAIINFEKARSIDPYLITYMDEYAMILKKKCDYSMLNKLVHDLLNIDPTRPEVFVALSVLWETKDERGALTYAEKSIRTDERHIAGFIMKGNLLLAMKQPEVAVSAFRNAQELRPDIRSYQGLVHSYLALSKMKEALYAAREAMKAMPQSAKALKLVGDVHASNSSGREKAKKFYESALRLEPGYLGAALALAELHVIEGRNGDAVSLLERYLKDWADDSLHVKLAQVFAATNMLQEALSHYQAALRMNPQNEAAKKGLERLEKQMKGVDPDAPDDDEDNEVDDAEGDQEETELL